MQPDNSFSSPQYINSWGAELSLIKLFDVVDTAARSRNYNYRWSRQQAQQFIESILLGLPIPSIYIAIRENEKYIIDGYHRIKTVTDFISGTYSNDGSEFRLMNSNNMLDYWNNKTYSQISDLDQNRIASTTVHLTIIELKNSSIISVDDLYKRINPSALDD